MTAHFSDTYSEARSRFLEACDESSARVEHIRHPRSGPDGGALFTDVADLGPVDATTVLVLSSGTHGVEGFCGSALQTAFLHERVHERLPPDTRLVMIHAINPYGFAWLRRFNEGNVDLNRNFVDHPDGHEPNKLYDNHAEIIAPVELNDATRQRLLMLVQQLGGLEEVQEFVTKGQFKHRTGLHFGGRERAWSNTMLQGVLEERCAEAKRVIMIDLHTGLGEHGTAEIIVAFKPGDPTLERARSWWGDLVAPAGSGVSPEITGPLKGAIPGFVLHAEVTAVSLEFGTVPPLEVFFAMQAENWLHNHAHVTDPRWDEIKANLRRAFYPDSDEWKRQVWMHAQTVLEPFLDEQGP